MLQNFASLPMTTMAYITKTGYCAQTPIPTKFVRGAVEKIGDMEVVLAGTCPQYGYDQVDGTGVMGDPDSDFPGNLIKFVRFNTNAKMPMTTMAYVSKDGWCAQTPIPTMYVKGAIEKPGDMMVVLAETCAGAGYPHSAGSATMEDPDPDFKGNIIKFEKFTAKVEMPMTTMAYVSNEGWCAETPIPSMFVQGAE